jgi:pSer/pThr/pTyr-binding forkhead associated (FHA) protein
MANELENIVGMAIRELSDQSILTVLRHGDFTIGRAHDNDLCIDNPTISGHHARIYTYLTASYIEDLNSRNGTYVDGKRIQKHVLKPGNIIKLGTQELIVEERKADEASTPTFKTVAN